MKKWISRIIDIVLVLVVGVLLYAVISMMVTKNNNYGVPKAFGSSFLYVATSSMDDPEQDNPIAPGTGIIIQEVSLDSIRASEPITENGEVVDYQKNGDVVTFYHEGLKAPDTHRVIEKWQDENGKYWFHTMGDNPEIHNKYKIYKGASTELLVQLDIIQEWSEDKLIGKEVFHEKWFGDFLTIASPSAAASAGKTAWFFPVAVIVPIVIIAGISVADTFIKTNKENKAREEELEKMMVEAGIDLNDEEAVELFRTKEEIRLDIKEQMEIEMEKARKKALKELKQKREKRWKVRNKEL